MFTTASKWSSIRYPGNSFFELSVSCHPFHGLSVSHGIKVLAVRHGSGRRATTPPCVCVSARRISPSPHPLPPIKQTQIEVSFERTRHQTRTSATCSTGNSLIERGIWFSALIRALGSCKLTNGGHFPRRFCSRPNRFFSPRFR